LDPIDRVVSRLLWCALKAALPLKSGGEVRLWALLAASGVLAVALAAPRLLHALNLVWLRFGMLLDHIVTPIVMGLLFFLVLMPLGLLMRVTGKDPMRLKRRPDLASYWILREPPGPRPETLKNQR
jgi:Saxitoxin biosynthesis operon protein SxtJ